jgi:LAGLIDADG endonuclease
MENLKKKNIDMKSWILGFVDGEGCFCVSFSKRERMPCGIEVRPSFSVSQKAKSLSCLQLISSFFVCGGIRYSRKDGTYKYEVRNLEDLRKTIIPFFKEYTLLTEKQKDFILFEKICDLMCQGQHLNKKGLELIISKAYLMNGSGKRKYLEKELLKFISKLKV